MEIYEAELQSGEIWMSEGGVQLKPVFRSQGYFIYFSQTLGFTTKGQHQNEKLLFTSECR